MDATEQSTAVRVAVRVRPMNERENKGNTLPVVTASTDKNEVTLIRGAGNRQTRQTFSFDAVHSSFSTQVEVFDTVRPLIADVMGGFEATVCCASLAQPHHAPVSFDHA